MFCWFLLYILVRFFGLFLVNKIFLPNRDSTSQFGAGLKVFPDYCAKTVVLETVISRPAALTSPGNLLENQIPMSHHGPAESETLWAGAQ